MKLATPAKAVRAVVHAGVRALRRIRFSSAAGPRVQVIAAVALVALAGGAGTKVVAYQLDQLPENGVFRSYGEVTTEQELDRRVKAMHFMYGLKRPEDPQRLDSFKRSVAKAVAVSEIIARAAREKNIVIPDRDARDKLAQLIKKNPKWKNRSEFVDELGNQGISERQVIEEIKRQLANVRLFKKVTADVKPTNTNEVRAYYNKHKAKMVSPEQRALANIVVASEKQAHEVAKRARSGANFGSLATKYSVDGSTKDKGGSLGTVTADLLVDKYAKAAFNAKEGSIFGPVQTSKGWNIGKVEKVHKATPLSFKQVKDAIKTKLTNQANFKVWNEFLAKCIADANVKYAPEYRPPNPDAPVGHKGAK